jgi:hypothetical protein
MSVTSLMTDIYSDLLPSERKRNASHGHICRAGAAFAVLQIGQRRYDIAPALLDDDSLAFRVEGQEEWTALDRTLEDGWVKIGADILLLDPDVLFDFLLTHAVSSVSDVENLNQLDFDTLGVRWSAVLLHDRDGDVRMGDGGWQYARLGLNAPKDGRKRAIMLLLSTLPNARSFFEPHITHWARRIAQDVSIRPAL